MVNPAKRRSRTPLALYLFLLVLCALLELGAASVGNLLYRDKPFFSYRFFHVVTASMSPKITPGDGILVQICPPLEVRQGDIIVYDSADIGEPVAHRVIDVQADLEGQPGLWFLTMGDGNRAPDPPVPARALIGKVVRVLPGLGKKTKNLPLHPESLFVLTAALGLVMVGALVFVIMYYVEPGRRERRP
ncbi:MAG: signal peptidase I [Oscillospiraceae bacterium]|jgi:signal peptidase|nr:signal peptidase I [Oscillospiraceae bacterium]